MSGNTSSTIAQNRKARHDYHISDEIEAGMVLVGSEVKSIRGGNVNLKDSYAQITPKGEVFVHQMHISPYPFAYYGNHDPLRPRKLLLNKAEIRKLTSKVNEKGFSIVPLSLYFKKGRIKMKIGLARGKKLFDKRQSIKERDAKRELARDRKNYID